MNVRKYVSFVKVDQTLLSCATVQFVADFPGVSWVTIRDIEKEYPGKHFANPSLKNVKYIAIDEIATKKGHVYMTVVLDTGSVIWSTSN